MAGVWRWLRWLLPLAFGHVAAMGAALVPLLGPLCGDAPWAPAGALGLGLVSVLLHLALMLGATAAIAALLRRAPLALRWCKRRAAAAGPCAAIAKRPLPGHDAPAPPCNSCGPSTSG